MTDRPTGASPQVRPLPPVIIGGVIGIVVVLVAVGDMGLTEVALIFLPVLVAAAAALTYYVWAKRRGDL